MKFSCSRDELMTALNLVKRAVATRSTMQVLEGILFNVEDMTLQLTATDLKLGVTTAIPVDAESDGAVVLNANLITNVISKLSGDSVYFSCDDKNRVKIESMNSEFVINGLPVEDFPEFPEIDDAKTFEIESNQLKNLINSTKFATATNENIPIITGLKMEVNGDNLRMVAIDGFRLALKKGTLVTPLDDDNEISAVVPGKSMNELSGMLPNSTEPVTVSLSPSQIFFSVGDTVVTTRLLEGKFIDYQGIFPTECTTCFTISKDDLLRGCERVALMVGSESNSLIRMDIDSGKLFIYSNSDRGSGQDVIDIENEGDDLKIAFNSKFFTDALKVINDNQVRVEMTTSVGPAELKPTEGEEYNYLILPVRLTDSV